MFRYTWLMILLVGACSPTVQTTKTSPIIPQPNKPLITKSEHQTLPAPFTAPQAKPPQTKLSLRYQSTTNHGIRIYLVCFDDRYHTLRVADQPRGIGTRWRTAQQAAMTYNGIAAINGGFFTPEGKPLGILIETGTKRGHINRSSLGAGIYLNAHQQSAVIRREAYQKSPKRWNAYNLLQAGPILIENHQPVSQLSKQNPRSRSFIAWDGKHHWAIGYAEACTLNALSHALTNKNTTRFKIKTALNLDGGRSSDLWASSQIPGGNKTHRGFFNKPVRNYLILTKR